LGYVYPPQEDSLRSFWSPLDIGPNYVDDSGAGEPHIRGEHHASEFHMARTQSKTAKFGGKRFTKKSNHSKKSTAKSAASSARKGGKSARVVKTKTWGYTVFTRG